MKVLGKERENSVYGRVGNSRYAGSTQYMCNKCAVTVQGVCNSRCAQLQGV